MGRWGDESIFLPAREATRFAIGRRGVSSAFSPFSFLNFHNFLRLRTEVKSTYRLQRYAQGFYRVRRNLSTSSRPTKKPRSQELTDQQKHLNQEKSSDRVKSEQTISGVNRYNAARG